MTFPWRVPLRRITLDRGQLAQVSINAIDQEFSLNNFNGQLTAFDWRAGSQPSGYLAGTLGDMGRGLFQPEAIEGKLAFSPAAGCRAAGQGIRRGVQRRAGPRHPAAEAHPEGSGPERHGYQLAPGWWQDWQGWCPQQIDIRKLAFDKLKVLSFDDTPALSPTGWQLYLNDLALRGQASPAPCWGVPASRQVVRAGVGRSQCPQRHPGWRADPSSWQLNALATSCPTRAPST